MELMLHLDPHGEDSTDMTPPIQQDSEEPSGTDCRSLTAPLYLQA